MDGWVQKVYFGFSFGFLVLRTISVALYAAWINDESKEPAPVLYSVPSSVYNIEVSTLLSLMHHYSISNSADSAIFDAY